MLVARLFGAGDVRLVECDIPEISHDEILLKTTAAAICGSDLRMMANGYKGVDEKNPLTLGHEFSGIIEKVGKDVKQYKKGMKICLAPNIGCGVCDECVSGNTHLCSEYQAFGINLDGGFAEYIKITAQTIAQGNIMVLDDNISMNVASMIEPMSCVLNGQEQVKINLNDMVLIIGAGPIGIMHALLAKATGASCVYMYDTSKERLKQVLEIDPLIKIIDGDNLKAEVYRLTNGRGVNVCITACSSVQVQAQALELMATNGRILYFGGLPAGQDMVSIPTNIIHYKQLGIFGSTRANISQYRAVVKMIMSGNLDLSKIISRCFTIKNFIEGVEYAKSFKGLKTVITFE